MKRPPSLSLKHRDGTRQFVTEVGVRTFLERVASAEAEDGAAYLTGVAADLAHALHDDYGLVKPSGSPRGWQLTDAGREVLA